jgi:hypothetical protein
MAETNNSLSTVLADFVRLQNNSLETLQQLQQATVSLSETVQIAVKEDDGTTSTYSIPSFGYLKSSIDRIDSTIAKMLGFDGSDAFIRQPDGSFKKIYQAKTPVNPTPIGQVSVPSSFISENNWFFENLMSPALKVSFDVTRYVPQQESKVFVKRMLLLQSILSLRQLLQTVQRLLNQSRLISWHCMKKSERGTVALVPPPLLAINVRVATLRSTQLSFRESQRWQKMKLSDAKSVDAFWCVIVNGAPL